MTKQRESNQLENIKTDNHPVSSAKKPDSASVMTRMSRGLKRYWFVAVPAIMLNVGITLDHVIAKNNENFFRVRIKEAAMEALEFSKSQDDSPLSETLQAHWITTNDDGSVDGRISAIEPNQAETVPIERLDVALLKKGEKVRKATTDANGKFVLLNVDPGVYTLVAAGQNGFLAYGVHVLPKLDGFDVLDGFDDLDENTSVDPKKQKHAYYVSHYNVPQDSVVAESLQIDAAAVPPSFATLQRISQSYLPSATAFAIGRDLDDAKALQKSSTIGSGFKYPLADDGSLEGRIQPIATSDGQAAKLSNMNVFLIQDDIEAARVDVEENGKFKISNVEPGVYSLVAAGQDGFAALSLELVAAEELETTTSTNGKTKAHFVSNRAVKRKAAPIGIAIVTDPRDIEAIKQEVNRVANGQDPANQFADQGIFQPDGFAPDGFGSGGGFPVDSGFGGFAGTPGPVGAGPSGGGRVFRGGNRGALAAIIGLSLGITALATNDSNVNNPPPQSPATPIP